LRRVYEPGLGGGVWIVVACENDYSRAILTMKGLIPNAANTTALIYRPYHLCGVETPISLLVAGLLGLPTGASEYAPQVDIIARAKVSLRAGDVLTGDHDPRLEFLLRPAQAVVGGAPLPLHLASGNPLVRDVPAGAIIRTEMVGTPKESALWSLRAEQDREFGLHMGSGTRRVR
jgi:predicted homoserine dehydrogenase-like protein